VRIVFDLRWEMEHGWVTLSFDGPLLCVIASEIGGRCETRILPEQTAQGEYFGTGHLSFIAASECFTIYAAEMRHARVACYLFDPTKADCLTSDQMMMIATTESRHMFRDERLYECARLLSEHDVQEDRDLYASSLARALIAALLGMTLRQPLTPPAIRLTGESQTAVLRYILDHLDKSVTIEGLAQIANLSPAQFSRCFREANGLSIHRWQMDARVRSAQRLMIDDPTQSLSTVAAVAGFSDQSHFSRAFLEVVGKTPSVWLHERR